MPGAAEPTAAQASPATAVHVHIAVAGQLAISAELTYHRRPFDLQAHYNDWEGGSTETARSVLCHGIWMDR